MGLGFFGVLFVKAVMVCDPGPFSWTLTYPSPLVFLSVKITAKNNPWGPQNMEVDRKFQKVWGGGVQAL